jgi:TonB family protein
MLQLRPFGLVILTMVVSVSLTVPLATQAQTPQERKVVEKIDPVYPMLAKRTNVRGVVKLEVEVRANGIVKAVKVVGGNPVLLDAATDAVRKWKFEATPAETTETVRVSFEPH